MARPITACEVCSGAGGDGHGHQCNRCGGMGCYPDPMWIDYTLRSVQTRVTEDGLEYDVIRYGAITAGKGWREINDVPVSRDGRLPSARLVP